MGGVIWAATWQNQQNDCIRPFWSVLAMPSVGSSLCGQRRLWSGWTDSKADLSLRWEHRSVCWFWHAAAHIRKWSTKETTVESLIRLAAYNRNTSCFIHGKLVWSLRPYSAHLKLNKPHKRKCHICTFNRIESHHRHMNEWDDILLASWPWKHR